MTNRVISLNFFKKTKGLSDEARLLYLYLCLNTDERNFAKNFAKIFEAEVFPRKKVNISSLLKELEEAGFILNRGEFIEVLAGSRNVLPKKIAKNIAKNIANNFAKNSADKIEPLTKGLPKPAKRNRLKKEKESNKEKERNIKLKDLNEKDKSFSFKSSEIIKTNREEITDRKEIPDKSNSISLKKSIPLLFPDQVSITDQSNNSCISLTLEELSSKSLNNKNLSNEKRCDSPTQFLLREYRRLYEEKYGAKPVMNWGKDGAIAKRIMNQPAVTVENIAPLLQRFFQDEDDFIKKAGHTLGVFEKRLPGYLERKVWFNQKSLQSSEPVSLKEAMKECLILIP